MRGTLLSAAYVLAVTLTAEAQWLSAQETTVDFEERTSLPEELTLEHAVELFRERNPLVRAERQREAAALGDLEQAGKWSNPFFSLDTEDLVALNGYNGGRTTFVGVGQEIQLGGQPGKRRSVAQSRLLAARNDVRAFEQVLTFRLKVTYAGLARAQSDLELASESLDEFDRIISLNRARYERGEISGGELRRVEAERLRFLEEQVAAEIAAEKSRAELLGLLGLPEYGETFRVVGPKRNENDLPDLETMIADALRERPEIQAQLGRKEAALRRVALEKSLAVPNLVPFVNYQKVSGGPSDFLNFGVSVGIPVLNRNQGAVARARAESRREEELERAIRYQVAVEVRQARQAYVSERRRVRFFEQTYLETSRQARDIAEAAYRMGGEDLINFLDANRVYRETLRSYNQALYDFRASRYALEVALGKDLP